MTSEQDPLNVAIVGPIRSGGGIATVIRTVTETRRFRNATDSTFLVHTSEYHDKRLPAEAWRAFAAFFEFFVLLVRKRIDIVHIHSASRISFYRKLLFFLLARVFQRPILFHLHANDFYEWFCDSRGVRRRLITHVFRASSRVVVLCDAWGEAAVTAFSLQNVVRIANPVAIDDPTPRQPTRSSGGPFRVLFMGFLVAYKGVFDLVEVASRFSPDSVRFLVCGKGELELEFKRRAAESAPSVDFIGWVDSEKKLDLYRDADVLFLPSYSEGMPMAILEAVGMGLPVVSTPVGGIPDVITNGHDGILCEPGDIDGFAAAIERLRTDADFLGRLAVNALETATRFSADAIAGEWIATYERVRTQSRA